MQLKQKNNDTQPSLDPLRDLCASDLQKVDALLYEYMQGEIPFIGELAGHVIAAGGKRLRPMLTLACASLCGYEGEGHVNLAAAVEMIHTATLLHDDVVDESDLRRGRKTANSLWGNAASVLVGDYLFSRSFQLMVEADDLMALKVLADAAALITQGEVMQLKTNHTLSTSIENYYSVIRGKTAALFAAACEVGAVLPGKSPEVQEALRVYGEALGMAFQIMDDILDYSAEQAELGKRVGDDFAEGKMTLPVILALGSASAVERQFWVRTFENHEQTEEDLYQAMKYMEQHKILSACHSRAQDFVAQAVAALDIFEDSAMKSALIEAAEFSIARAF